jgi:hypothetical protein
MTRPGLARTTLLVVVLGLAHCPRGTQAQACPAGTFSATGVAPCALCAPSTPFSTVGAVACTACTGLCNSTFGRFPCKDSSWALWWDAAGVEGAHSCLKFFGATPSVWAAANASCVNEGAGSHLVTSRQTAQLTVSGTDLMSVAFGMTGRSEQTLVGAYRVGTAPLFGWTWVDGTPAANLNCGSMGCNLWGSSGPDNSQGVEDRAAFSVSVGRLNDVPSTYPAGHTCEAEWVCAAGHFCATGTAATPQMLCAAGQYSLAQASSCTPCPAGRFGSTHGLTDASCSGPCSAGFSCGAGSTNATAAACPVGRFSQPGASACSPIFEPFTVAVATPSVRAVFVADVDGDGR